MLRWGAGAYFPCKFRFSPRPVGVMRLAAARVLCAAPFFAVGQNKCAVFFGGSVSPQVKNQLACFSPKYVCSLPLYMFIPWYEVHVYWSSFSAIFLANCIRNIPSQPAPRLQKGKTSTQDAHFEYLYRYAYMFLQNGLRQPSGGPPAALRAPLESLLRGAHLTYVRLVVRCGSLFYAMPGSCQPSQ